MVELSKVYNFQASWDCVSSKVINARKFEIDRKAKVFYFFQCYLIKNKSNRR